MTELPPGVEQKALPWDSDFFGFRVGQVTVTRDIPAGQLITCLDTLPYDLAYVVLHDPWQPLMLELSQRAQHVSDRCVFQRPTRPGRLHRNVVAISPPATPALQELARAAGWQSRFQIDERLRPHFSRMYDFALDRALVASPVCAAFAYQLDGEPVGLLTIVVVGEVGEVGLLAVHADCRGQGIGAALLDVRDWWHTQHGVPKCRIVTQKSNTGAVGLYRKTGHELVEETPIFHFWSGQGRPQGK